MDDNETGLIVFFGFLAVILVLILMLPVEGTIFGMTVSLPLIGWIALVVFAIIALYLLIRHK